MFGWLVIIMMRGRMKPLEQEICGWGQQKHGLNYTKPLGPSLDSRGAVLPQLSLKRNPVPLPDIHKNSNLHSNRVLPSNRLKTASYETYTIETEVPLRLFPSLPMLSSAERVGPHYRENSGIDPFEKSFKKYRQIQEVFHSKLLHNRPKPVKAQEQTLHKTQNNNPETFRKRQSKETLKLSTIQIDSDQIKKTLKGVQNKIDKTSPKRKVPLARSRMLVRNEFQAESEVFQDASLKKSHSKALPPLKYEGEFSDQTIFPKILVADFSSHLIGSSSAGQRILVRPK